MLAYHSLTDSNLFKVWRIGEAPAAIVLLTFTHYAIFALFCIPYPLPA